jgi:hypothetical protein
VPAAKASSPDLRIKDVASLAFAGASAALSAAACSAAERVNNQMPMPAAAATRMDARQSREINRCRSLPGAARTQPPCRRSDRSCWFVFALRARGVLCRIPNAICPIQALGGTLDCARWREPQLGAPLRRHFRILDPAQAFPQRVRVLHSLLSPRSPRRRPFGADPPVGNPRSPRLPSLRRNLVREDG